ncbi:hypothetical protein WAX87_12890 [Photobacterium damselae subsp. damselae]|uniref:hypothetical protein n=1 Tax=Photobacterium damselae TaxID=38293 RepID=UPI001F3273D6|nr:hypothetical protein [Photobacterium damselae]UKA10634.1 hypothetical protein IHC91_02520 [Photobacterium damselae subsp. damselae]
MINHHGGNSHFDYVLDYDGNVDDVYYSDHGDVHMDFDVSGDGLYILDDVNDDIGNQNHVHSQNHIDS